MKTSELIGPALVWAVAKCEGEDVSVVVVDGEAQVWSNEDIYDNYNGQDCYTGRDGTPRFLRNGKPVGVWGNPMPSYLDWAQGGPIIERERIRIDCPWNPGPFEATCKIDGVTGWCEGPTILVAAMRCYCCAKLGDEIDIPEELQPCQQPNL